MTDYSVRHRVNRKLGLPQIHKSEEESCRKPLNLRDKIDEIAKLEVQDVGKPYGEAVDDAMTGPDAFEFFGSIPRQKQVM